MVELTEELAMDIQQDNKEKKFLERAYARRKSSLEYIARYFGITADEVEAKLQKHGIPIRRKRDYSKIEERTNYSYSYRRIMIDGRWILEHRYVWEQVHGVLPKGWIIHHINGVKDDNRLVNLVALPRDRHTSNGIKNEAEIKRILELEGQVKDLEELVKGYEEILEGLIS